MCNSISRYQYYEKTELEDKVVHLHNPLSNDLNCMRTDLIFGGLESISRNIKRQQTDTRFFEFGKTYQLNKNAEINKAESYTENIHLGMWMSGNQSPINWNIKDTPTNIYQLKGFAELIIKRIGADISKCQITELKDFRFTYGIKYEFEGKHLISIGNVNNSLLEKTSINQDVFYADINWDNVIALASSKKTQFKELPKFFKVRRDLALLLDKNITYQQVKEIAYNTERKYLKEVQLFDIYEGKNLKEGKKSYAVMFVLQDETRTMKDKQIDKIMNKLIANYKNELGAEIR